MSVERKALWLLLLVPAALVAGQDRIQSATDRSVSVGVKGSLAAQVAQSIDLGAVSPTQQMQEMRIEIAPTAEQQVELDALLGRQNDPQSADYHRWLTPDEFGDRFGASANDLGQVQSWLESEGFQVSRVTRGHNAITFNGTAATVQSAFQTEIHSYRTRGEMHFSNATEPRIPAAFRGVVTGVHGLNDFQLHPMTNHVSSPEYTTGGTHYLSPNDLASIYNITALYNGGYNGNGQKMVVVGQTEISLTDIRSFRSQFGLPANDPQLVLAGTNPGFSANDRIEAALDVEWAGAVARNASIIYVYSTNIFTSLIYAVNNNLAPVISMSYGGCETGTGTSYRAIAQQANAQGITWINASGDTGAAGCDYGATIAQNGPAVQFPANIPEVTAVGGSEFSETGNAGWNTTNTINWASAIGYLSETGWNDSVKSNALESSTGGASTIYPKPWWQAGAGVPSDGARDVPDVALSASASHDGYLIYSGGGMLVVGGTSAGAPAFAGITTLLNQYLVAKGLEAKPGLGNINPTLYSMAQATTGVFHDITTGNNVVPCVIRTKGCTTGSFGFQAGQGYDFVTGLGSVDAFNLATKWNLSTTGVGTTMTLTSSATSIAQSGSAQITAIVAALTGTNPPTGNVTFKAGSVTLGSAAVVASTGAQANANFTVNGAALIAGANMITASYQATGSFAANSMTTTVTVNAPAVPATATTLSVIAAPASIATSASTTLSATVKAASGSTIPAGTISFKLGATTLGTSTLTSGTAALSVKGSSLSNGSNNITVSYTPSNSFTASTGSTTVTVSAPATSTSATTLTASTSAISNTGTTQLTAMVTANGTTSAPTGSVTFSAGTKVLGTVTLTGAGTTAIAIMVVPGSSLTAGVNSITAAFGGSTSVSASASASVNVMVTAAPVATSTLVVAGASSILRTASTTITVTVHAASGSSIPTGTVTAKVGTTTLATATLSASGTATITVAGSKLAVGANTITVAYAGTTGFNASNGATTITAK